MLKEKEEGIEALLNLLDKEQEDFVIGDTLQVKGKLSFYNKKWEV